MSKTIIKKMVFFFLLFILVSTCFKVLADNTTIDCNGYSEKTGKSNWDINQTLPTFINRQALFKTLQLDKTPIASSAFKKDILINNGEVLSGIGIKLWPYHKNYYVIVIESDLRKSTQYGGYETLYRNLRVALIEKISKYSMKIIAKTLDPFQLLPDDKRDNPDPHFNKFDFAPYRISPNYYAIGLRHCSVTGPWSSVDAHSTSWEDLDLFEVSGTTINRILSTPMIYNSIVFRRSASNFEKDNKQLAILQISPEKTMDHYNLVKSFNTDTTKIRQIFKWDGHQYKSTEKDLFSIYYL